MSLATLGWGHLGSHRLLTAQRCVTNAMHPGMLLVGGPPDKVHRAAQQLAVRVMTLGACLLDGRGGKPHKQASKQAASGQLTLAMLVGRRPILQLQLGAPATWPLADIAAAALQLSCPSRSVLLWLLVLLLALVRIDVLDVEWADLLNCLQAASGCRLLGSGSIQYKGALPPSCGRQWLSRLNEGKLWMRLTQFPSNCHSIKLL